MEQGFYHPARGYWQAIDVIDADHLAKLMLTYPEGTVQVPVKPGVDYEWQDDEWVYVEPPPVPLPVPQEISRRQLYQGLAVAEKITKNEAIAAIASGTIPSAIQTILDNMEDEDAKFEATMLLIGATEFNRNHPLVMIFAISQEMSEQDVDNFWLMCSEL